MGLWAWLERKAAQAEASTSPEIEFRVEQVAIPVEPVAPPDPVPDPDRPGFALANVGPGWIEVDEWLEWGPPRNAIVGESNYQAALRRVCGRRREVGWCRAVEVTFIREPDNPHDANAVMATIDGQPVGYLPRDHAEYMAPVLDDHAIEAFAVCSVVRGGWLEAPSFGCHVWMDRRPVSGPPFAVEGDDRLVGNWPPDPDELDDDEEPRRGLTV